MNQFIESRIEQHLVQRGLKILKSLGDGSFGYVFRVQRGDQFYAMKVISHSENLALINSIHLEIEIMQTLRHDNLCTSIEYFQADDFYCLLMKEYSCDLQQLLFVNFQPVGEMEAITIMKQIYNAVYYLHGRNIIHRDIKLQNIFVDCPFDLWQQYKEKLIPINQFIGNCKFILADFGISKRLSHENFMMTNSMVGSRSTIAPEIIQNRPYSFPADIYSLGQVFYRLLKNKYYNPGIEFDLDFSDETNGIICGMLQENPSLRPSKNMLDGFFKINRIKYLKEQRQNQIEKQKAQSLLIQSNYDPSFYEPIHSSQKTIYKKYVEPDRALFTPNNMLLSQDLEKVYIPLSRVLEVEGSLQQDEAKSLIKLIFNQWLVLNNQGICQTNLNLNNISLVCVKNKWDEFERKLIGYEQLIEECECKIGDQDYQPHDDYAYQLQQFQKLRIQDQVRMLETIYEIGTLYTQFLDKSKQIDQNTQVIIERMIDKNPLKRPTRSELISFLDGEVQKQRSITTTCKQPIQLLKQRSRSTNNKRIQIITTHQIILSPLKEKENFFESRIFADSFHEVARQESEPSPIFRPNMTESGFQISEPSIVREESQTDP